LAAAVLAETAPAGIVAVDTSEGFLEAARSRNRDGRATFRVGDAQALPVVDSLYDAVVSALMLNFVPDPHRAVTEFARAAAEGGVIAAYVWDYAEGMTMMRHFWEAATVLDPAATQLDEGLRFPLCRPEPLRDLWAEVGLRDVDVHAIDVPTTFVDFDDYWDPFLGGQGAAPSYVATLSEDERRALRDLVRARLPVEADGQIRLTARAWAVRGTLHPSQVRDQY
jgi:SAM-dependent methyltransferase